jgi:hypothetical protein
MAGKFKEFPLVVPQFECGCAAIAVILYDPPA